MTQRTYESITITLFTFKKLKGKRNEYGTYRIAGASGQALADMMGVSTQQEGSSKKSSNLARLSITHTSVMGEVEVAGKLRKDGSLTRRYI